MTRRLDASRLRTLFDAALAAAVFVVSLSLGVEVLADLSTNMISYTLPAAAMAACGRGLAAPGAVTPGFAAFVKRARPSTSCDDVIGRAAPLPPDAFSMGYRYAIYSVAAALRVGGLSWKTLDWYVATLFAVSMTLTYLLFRMAVGPVLAAGGVGALIFSNHVLAVALDLRDYGKQVWFASLWVVLTWLLARGLPRVSRAILLPVCVAGVILGVGIGFRGDLLIFLPVFLAVVFLALPGWTGRALATKAMAMATFLMAFGLAGWPILSTLGGGSNFAHFAVLGLSAPMTRAMGIEAPAYDAGDLYADGFAYMQIAAHAVVSKGEHEIGTLSTKLYDRQGTALVTDVVRHFPADFIARGFGATRQILAYPFDPIVEWDVAHSETLNRGFLRLHLVVWRVRLSHLLHGWELYLAAIAFLAVAVRDIRKALIGASLVLYFCGYSLIQFGRRHTFHLDVVTIAAFVIALGGALSAIDWIARELRSGRSLRSVAAHSARRLLPPVVAALTLLAAGGGVLWLVRHWQQRHVTALLDRTLEAKWTPAEVTREPLAPFLRDRHEPLTEWFAWGLHRMDPQPTGDWWSSAMLLRVNPARTDDSVTDNARTIRASYMLVEMGGSACAAGTVPIVALYSSSTPTIDADYTRAFYPAVDGAAGTSRLVLPILESDRTRFEGFAVAAERAGCVQRVLRASSPRAIPLPVLFASLAPDWRSKPLYQRLASRVVRSTAWGIPALDTKQP
jgi:hypothetical protein